jgi:hypothetical protein
MFNIFINNIFDFVKKGDLHNYTDDNILSYGSNSVDDVIETLDRAPDKLRISKFGAYLYAVNDNTVVYIRLPETC